MKIYKTIKSYVLKYPHIRLWTLRVIVPIAWIIIGLGAIPISIFKYGISDTLKDIAYCLEFENKIIWRGVLNAWKSKNMTEFNKLNMENN